MDILEAIRANRRQHREHTDAANVLDSKLRDLVKMAFKQGRTGPELASVLGISKERVYQIRDGRR
ncbi:sigma factor-like helix-turn-helix DNA-binding protein [Mycobacterium sp. 48b]|uniref:sigma factor-like helix-turn-helix DNA-binding protein n=1 Tax=Mycobacterium sp. 48b TaxID=3400426 RepID=UPI003AAA42B3